MRGNEAVIQQLNEALKAELTAIVQYIVHAEMCQNWGYHQLGGYIKKQAIDEMKHAEGLIERILFLDGTPKVDVMPTPRIGASVRAQLENDLAAELEAVGQYNSSVAICGQAGDNASRALFEKDGRRRRKAHRLPGSTAFPDWRGWPGQVPCAADPRKVRGLKS